MSKPTFLEFFAGAGLVRAALEPSWRCVWANDVSRKKADVYIRNFGDHDFLLRDVAELVAKDVPSATMAWASFPCQDLSLAGWRKGMSAARSGTFWAFWRLMHGQFEAGFRPPIITIENVVGLLYGDNFSGLCEALAALEMRFGAMVVDARSFLPQSRPRVFVVAIDSRVSIDGLAHEGDPGNREWFTPAIRSAYDRLPEQLKDRWVWWNLPMPQSQPVPVHSVIDWDAREARWRSDDEVVAIKRMMTGVNLRKLKSRVESGGRHVGFLYRRMRGGKQRAEVRFDGVAGCLRTPEGGSSRQTVVLIDNGRVRMRLLTPEETARLMGAPDGFWLPDNYNDAYRAMGDAVAVPAVGWIAEHLLLPLANSAEAAQGALTDSPATDASRSHSNAERNARRWLQSAALARS